MRKKLIELMKAANDYGNELCAGRETCLGCSYADDPHGCEYGAPADHLLNSGVTIPKWIPVEEWLPEKEEYVLCHSNKHGGYMFVGYRGYLSGEWVEGNSLHLKDVTHWMPLPEPPREGE